MTSITTTLALCLAGATITAGALFLPARDEADDAPSADAVGQNDAITIAGFAFSGATEAATGDTLTVTNDDSVPHTLTAVDGEFDTGVIGPGASIDLAISGSVGTVEYFCEIHPSMTGQLNVDG